MKANHNGMESPTITSSVVVNINKSKNESKSQQIVPCPISQPSCGKYQ